MVYLLVFTVTVIVLGCAGFLHGIQCDAAQSTLLISMQFKLLSPIVRSDASYLLRLLAIDSLPARDAPEVRMSQAAGARWALVWIPGDHLVDQI